MACGHWYYRSPSLVTWNHHEKILHQMSIKFLKVNSFPAINNDSKLGGELTKKIPPNHIRKRFYRPQTKFGAR